MKRFLSIFLAAILVILQVPSTGFAYRDGVPNIIVTSSTTYQGKPGESISISVDLKNTGYGYAENITGNLSEDPTGMVYVDGSSYDNIRSMRDRESGTLSYRVKIDPDAEGKNYSLPLEITYYGEPGYREVPSKDKDGKVIVDEETGENKLEREELPAEKFTTKANINVRVTQDKTKSQLIVESVDILPSPNVKAGEVIAVGFNIKNSGSAAAEDVKVSLGGLSGDGFALASGVNSRTIQSISSGSKKYVYFELTSAKKISSGNHELKLNLTYKNSKGEAITEENNFFITVANQGQSSNLIIENLTYPTGSIGQNKEATVGFSIRNQGQSDAKNIIVEAKSTDPAGVVPKSVSIIKLDSLASQDSKKLEFKFLSTQAAETKNYPIEITVKYTDDLGKEDTVEQFVGIFVLAPEKGDPTKGKPKLIIDKYSFDPQLVKAGENFEMTLSFYNTSSKKTVRNIKIFLTAEAAGNSTENQNSASSAFTPVDSSNTFYIDSISPKGRIEKTITMFTVPDAVAKTHIITANFEYEDNEGTELKDVELIGVPVVQQSRLETGELGVYPEAAVGQPLPVSLEFYNTGKVTLYNMMVKLEGDFQTENGSYYVGNFDSGGSEYFEGTVIPNAPGELTGAVVFTYEDSTGQTQELRKEFTLNVMDAPPMEEFPEDFPPDGDMNKGGIKGILTSKWLWSILAIVAASVGGYFFYKKKKKQKEEALDE